MRERERQQRSKEFGIKLAKLLRRRATEAKAEANLDPRYVMLGAAEYLRKQAEFQIDPPIDTARVEPEDRRN